MTLEVTPTAVVVTFKAPDGLKKLTIKLPTTRSSIWTIEDYYSVFEKVPTYKEPDQAHRLVL